MIGWSLALAAMTFLAPRPSAVSADQVRLADAVVIGRFAERGDDHLQIERVLSGDLAAGDVVTVLNLTRAPLLAEGGDFVVPLTHFRQDYVVTLLDGQRDPPLIYRATPETIDQVKRVLREHR